MAVRRPAQRGAGRDAAGHGRGRGRRRRLRLASPGQVRNAAGRTMPRRRPRPPRDGRRLCAPAAPAGGAAGVAAGLAAAARQRAHPMRVWTNEAVHVLGALLTGLAALQLFEALEKRRRAEDKAREEGEERRVRWETMNIGSWVLLLLSVVYSVVGVLTGSNFIWSCATIVFGAWFGAMFGYRQVTC
jgi:hypothetical protein